MYVKSTFIHNFKTLSTYRQWYSQQQTVDNAKYEEEKCMTNMNRAKIRPVFGTITHSSTNNFNTYIYYEKQYNMISSHEL